MVKQAPEAAVPVPGLRHGFEVEVEAVALAPR